MELLKLFAGIAFIIFLCTFNHIHNAGMLRKLRRDIAVEQIDNLYYLGEPYNTTKCLRVASYAYGGVEDYANHVRSALYINLLGKLFIVEKGGSSQCKSDTPYVLTEEREIRQWMERHLPEVKYKAMKDIAYLVDRCCMGFEKDPASLTISTLGKSEYCNDVVAICAEEFRKEAPNWNKVNNIHKLIEAKLNLYIKTYAFSIEQRINNASIDEEVKEAIYDFTAAIKNTNDYRLLKYAKLAEKLVDVRSVDIEKVYGNYFDYGLAVEGHGGLEKHFWIITHFENNVPVLYERYR